MYEYAHAELYHHGVKGMKWGVRRYQNKDGSLTAAGKTRMNKQHDPRYAKEVKTLVIDDPFDPGASKGVKIKFTMYDDTYGKSSLDYNIKPVKYTKEEEPLRKKVAVNFVKNCNRITTWDLDDSTIKYIVDNDIITRSTRDLVKNKVDINDEEAVTAFLETYMNIYGH